MALPKGVGYMVVLLVICYYLEKLKMGESLHLYLEEHTGTEIPGTALFHSREKREVLVERTFEFRMDHKYEDALNNQSNAFYININEAIQAVASGDMDFSSARLIRFRQGSVIAEYVVAASSATSFYNAKITALRKKIFTKIETDYGFKIIREEYACRDSEEFGDGKVGDEAKAGCKEGEVREKTAVCTADGNWDLRQDTCILKVINFLVDQSQNLQSLTEEEISVFLGKLSSVTEDNTKEVVSSPANIGAIVGILNSVANISIPINKALMKDILTTVDVIISDASKDSWKVLNDNATKSKTSEIRSVAAQRQSGSNLLNAIETITGNLNNDSFVIETTLITLNKTTLTGAYNNGLKSSVFINIPDSNIPRSVNITTVIFVSMHNVLPTRNVTNNDTNSTVINGNVVLVKTKAAIKNMSFTFDIFNETLGIDPQCVFWNFSLFRGLGAWDTEGCMVVNHANGTVTCNCNHNEWHFYSSFLSTLRTQSELQPSYSFSILVSPFIPFDKEFQDILDYITYIGVGISMGCLVICLIIETVIWRGITRNSTSYMRHVSIINIAVSLLIADIWFIIRAAISEPQKVSACTAVTFFIHLFYLSMFFWMLAGALLLLYRTIFVFSHMSKKTMLAIGFSLGYGAPVIIAIITIAVTAPDKNYIQRNTVCWLNWDKALLAFVIPALGIVATNLLILIVVMFKMLRRGRGDSSPEEQHVLVTIYRSLVILMPVFGTTWGLGLGTMTYPHNKGIHVAFVVFNSPQGFFMLFGTLLMDKKIRDSLKRDLRALYATATRTLACASATNSIQISSENKSNDSTYFESTGIRRGRATDGNKLTSGATSSNRASRPLSNTSFEIKPSVSSSGLATRSITETLPTGLGFFRNLRRENGYNVTSGATSTVAVLEHL